ncbi:MAG: SgcJ/EcaC family oxidoreductase [Pirellulaceae bacterium]
MNHVGFTIMLVIWGTFCSNLFADQAADEAAIRQAVEQYVVAYNRSDAKAVAAMWSPEAVYTNRQIGQQVSGRQAIEQQFAAIFAANKDSKLAASTNSVEFISPGVAVEFGTATVVTPEQDSEESGYTAVYVKRDGAWLLDGITEEDIPVVQSNYEHLKDLEWMIGTWVDQDDQSTVETTCEWTKNRNFITRMFSVTVRDRIEASGMQIVGWDPATKQIRSWVFDSDGGFGEGTWSKKNQAWHIQATGTIPDGSKSSSVNIIKPIDSDTFTWQSIHRIAAGALLPNVAEFVVVRQTASE